ncbi:hypothetical protein [Ideonella sp.]|jgi:hypothetical protein|uniref:hypothetical protein n=1 Tax=Ideonella sp. TaxID=1929293 RepID=UPI0037C0713F
MFREFDDYLNLEFLADYWYDEGTGIASRMLCKFAQQDWMELKEQCLSRADPWKIRCAEVLELVSHPVSRDVLVEFLASQNDDVVVAAADSLRSKDEVHLTLDSIERLRRLSAHGSAPVKAVLSRFLSQLGAA